MASGIIKTSKYLLLNTIFEQNSAEIYRLGKLDTTFSVGVILNYWLYFKTG